MNLKKFAVRGIVVLAIFVALCMFFSGTIRTITTPKIKLAAAKRGKLEEKIDLSGKLTFTDVEGVGLELPEETTLTIVKVNTRPGYTCKAGDVLVQAKVTNFEATRKQYQDAYDTASEQLLTLENKNRGIRITRRDQIYTDAYYALREARREAVAKELAMNALLTQEKLTRTETGYPEGASDALMEAMDAWRAAKQAQDTAQSAMDDAARYTVDENVWSYITEKRELEDKLKEAEADLQQLLSVNEQAREILAPHDGYIAEIKSNEGDTYDGTDDLLTLTAEGAMPVLRADISELKRVVNEGTTVNYAVDSYYSVETEVVGTGTDTEGKKYADVELTEELIREKGSVYAMTLEDVPLVLVYKARESTTLLPVSAVRGSGDDRYIFTVDQESGAFGATFMKVHRMNVKVLAESGGTVSLEEDVSYYSIAYMEDRPINDGDTVMEYVG